MYLSLLPLVAVIIDFPAPSFESKKWSRRWPKLREFVVQNNSPFLGGRKKSKIAATPGSKNGETSRDVLNTLVFTEWGGNHTFKAKTEKRDFRGNKPCLLQCTRSMS